MSSEEQQIQDFVHEMQKPAFREHVLVDLEAAFEQLGYSERVRDILRGLLPALVDESLLPPLPPPLQHFI